MMELNLTKEEMQLVLIGLAELPLRVSFNLFVKLSQEIQKKID